MSTAGEGQDRSVHDLIVAAQREAGATMWDLGAEHAQPRLRTLSGLTEAAIDVWQQLDGHPQHVTDREPDPTLDHFIALTHGLKRTQRRAEWPEPGPGDRHLARAAHLLTRAADLMRAGGGPVRLNEEPGQGTHLARLQVAQVVMIAAHAVNSDLAAHTRDLKNVRVGRSRASYLLHEIDRYREHVAGLERHAIDYADGRWLDPHLGATSDPADTARLENALAAFDRRAHKILAYGPTVADLHLITQTQRHHAAVTGIVATAATTHQPAERAQVERGLIPALASLEGVLGRLATDLDVLSANAAPVDRALVETARELQSAMHDLTAPLGRNASPDEMAGRAPLDRTTHILTLALASTASMATSIREATESRALTAPAKGIKALVDRINLDYATTRDQHPRDPDWRSKYDNGLAARDLFHNRESHLPAAVTGTLLRTTDHLAAAATTANAAGAAIRPASQARAGQVPLRDAARLDGRREQDRAVAPELGPGRRPSR